MSLACRGANARAMSMRAHQRGHAVFRSSTHMDAVKASLHFTCYFLAHITATRPLKSVPASMHDMHVHLQVYSERDAFHLVGMRFYEVLAKAVARRELKLERGGKPVRDLLHRLVPD